MLWNAVVFLLLAAATSGCVFMLLAAIAMPARPRAENFSGPAAAVTLLKPLHGDEAGLYENLASCCEQHYDGPVQIVFGVARADDPAVALVGRLRAAYPGRALELVIDPHVSGSNPKVSNLINMSGRIEHDIVVLADSDIRVGPDYLSRLVSALDRQQGGAVTCPYYGIATESLWSKLAQLNIDSHFLPGVVLGSKLGLTRPCLGSTIALRRSSLDAIGGFEAVADCLADDYELGAALAARGEPVTVLPFAVGHICDEPNWDELWRHELRWTLTIRLVNLAGYCGWVITHAFPLALLALCLGGGGPAIFLAIAALGCRSLLLLAVESGYGLPRRPHWLIPLRDILSFAVFVAGFAVNDVSWRGQHYRAIPEGTMTRQRRPPSP